MMTHQLTRNILRRMALLVLAAGLTGCDPAAKAQSGNRQVATQTGGSGVAKVAAQTPDRYGFPVTITFTPKAAARYAKSPGNLQIAYTYKGDPIPAKKGQVDGEDGSISLGHREVTVPARPPVKTRVPGGQVNAQRLPWVKRLNVLVEVYGSMDLYCGGFEGSLEAAKRGVNILCKMQSDN